MEMLPDPIYLLAPDSPPEELVTRFFHATSGPLAYVALFTDKSVAEEWAKAKSTEGTKLQVIGFTEKAVFVDLLTALASHGDTSVAIDPTGPRLKLLEISKFLELLGRSSRPNDPR